MTVPYNHRAVEKKWHDIWEEHPVNVDDGKKPFKVGHLFKLKGKEHIEIQHAIPGDIADPATASEYAWFMELMNVANAPAVVKGEKKPEELGIKAIDDKTLEVRLTAPTPYLLKTLAHPSTFPAPQKVIEAEGDNWTEAGKLVGNKELEQEGIIQNAAGQVEAAYGDLKQDIKKVVEGK